jgi:signal peptidase I
VIRTIKLLTLLAVVVSLLGMALQVVVIPTASMEGTVLVGDHLLIDRFAYGPEIPLTHVRLPRLKTPQRGEVVSFYAPGHSGDVYLKRVVAVGGDRVQWHDGVLYVNGERRWEPYVESGHDIKSSTELLVPQGRLYMLGDNRDHSEDSRVWGTVPEESVVGEPVVVLWSIASPTERWLRSQTAVYFDHPVAHLRWQRFLQPVE